jgi:hypothetical protein
MKTAPRRHSRRPPTEGTMDPTPYPRTAIAVPVRDKLVTHSRTAAAILERAGIDLPEVISIGVTQDGITITPWEPGAPVHAMRAFEALMTGAIDRKAYPNPVPDSANMSILSSTGTIDGVKVTVTAATYRPTPVDGFLGVTEQTVADIAALERPHADPRPDEPILANMLADEPDTEETSDRAHAAVAAGAVDDPGADGPGDGGGTSTTEG